MTDAVEVAIEAALLNSAVSFAATQSITIALPNIAFVPPAVSATAKYLRASFMPAPSFGLGISFTSKNQHQGIFQIDVFYGQGSGELAPARIAASALSWFKRGTTITRDGFTVEILNTPYRGPLLKDDPWMMLPVSIPYIAFASPPA